MEVGLPKVSGTLVMAPVLAPGALGWLLLLVLVIPGSSRSSTLIVVPVMGLVPALLPVAPSSLVPPTLVPILLLVPVACIVVGWSGCGRATWGCDHRSGHLPLGLVVLPCRFFDGRRLDDGLNRGTTAASRSETGRCPRSRGKPAVMDMWRYLACGVAWRVMLPGV